MLKVREDPMFAIKKREAQAVTEILQNPIKLKRLKAVTQNVVPMVCAQLTENKPR